MRTSSKLLAMGALLALGSAACGDFLMGPGLTTNPDAPASASAGQRLAAVQAALTVQFTGTLARSACMWVQQCSGVDRQYTAIGSYSITEDDFDSEWQQVYSGGGLIDIRAVQAQAAGDSVFVGIGKVLEAMDIGIAADLWGDIPYAEAVAGSAAPHFDSQQSVYTHVLAVLDTAILDLKGAGTGPGSGDLWYGGDPKLWGELAHTLKARFYLHMAKQIPSSYANALAEARLGISTAAHDLKTYQSAVTSENNMWYQFQVVQRNTYLRMGAWLVDSVMNTRRDPRLPNYFALTLTALGRYHGAKPAQAQDDAVMSNLSATRIDPAYRQPLVTFAEVQLIIAEAANQTGDQVTALASLNAERAAANATYCKPSCAAPGAAGVVDSLPVDSLPALTGSFTAAALLDSIMVEKYVVTFQNLEAWNDYKRECIPAIIPVAPATHVIGRMLYGSSERSTNPNFPGEPASGRNWNDPAPC